MLPKQGVLAGADDGAAHGLEARRRLLSDAAAGLGAVLAELGGALGIANIARHMPPGFSEA